ncbi:MAG: hypothetical protein LH466_02310 [Sphingomonas bacterium]|nr:hypothetical protein [Sphingomonas bacterium]
MTVKIASIAMTAMLVMARPAVAQDAASTPDHAIGTDVLFSTDADKTDIFRLGANLDWHHQGPEEYQGFRLERIAYRPSGQARTLDHRVYFRIADKIGGWKYNAALGTDGDTVLGNAAIHDEAPLRKELFVERDKVETPIGVSRGIYYTFGGAAVDLPLAEHTQLTLLGGLQAFTGSDLRTHLRANLIHVVAPKWGLSAQLRTRYFRNSDPREFDYFSPRWYAEALPVLQLRRFSGGWRYLAAAGLGAQRDSGSGWRQSRYFNLGVTSPVRRSWRLAGDVLYSSTPITNSDTYHYVRANLSLTRAF